MARSRRESHHSDGITQPLGTPEEEFEVTELKKNALDPTRQFVFQ
jgi:hypothetical protein